MQYRKMLKGAEQISVLGIGTSSIQASNENKRIYGASIKAVNWLLKKFCPEYEMTYTCVKKLLGVV